jgi:hypothetical protein
MTLIRRFLRTLDLLHIQNNLIIAQRSLIDQQREQLHRQALDHTRELQGLVAGWLIHCDTPETDLRPELAELERDLCGQIARLEEHVL